MKLPDASHLAQPWRIHALAPDFRLEDVWALPAEGAAGDFPRLVELIAAGDPSEGGTAIARALFAIRWKLGELFGWDDPDDAVPTLRDRVPAGLEGGPEFRALPFSPLYLTDHEWAGEIANRTMHGVMHLGWVPAAPGSDRYRAQMAVLVKPNGLTGKAYMMAIRPFRHLIVYPALMRQGRALWARV
jgi:hypothetical protein